MRRITPIIIIVVGLLALAVDFSFAIPGGLLTTNPITGNPIETRLGLDLQGGIEVDYQVVPVNGRTPTSSDLNTIVGIIDRRVNATGTTEPIIETKGTNQVSVQLPGASDVQSVVALVGSTGQLTFVPLPPATYGTSSAAGTKAVPADGDAIDPSLTPLFGGDQVDVGQRHIRHHDERTCGCVHTQGSREDHLLAVVVQPHRRFLRHRPRRQGRLCALHQERDHRRQR